MEWIPYIAGCVLIWFLVCSIIGIVEKDRVGAVLMFIILPFIAIGITAFIVGSILLLVWLAP